MKELYEYQELTEKMNRIVQKGWIKSVNNGDSGVGLTLENELDIHSEDFEIPEKFTALTGMQEAIWNESTGFS